MASLPTSCPVVEPFYVLQRYWGHGATARSELVVESEFIELMMTDTCDFYPPLMNLSSHDLPPGFDGYLWFNVNVERLAQGARESISDYLDSLCDNISNWDYVRGVHCNEIGALRFVDLRTFTPELSRLGINGWTSPVQASPTQVQTKRKPWLL